MESRVEPLTGSSYYWEGEFDKVGIDDFKIRPKKDEKNLSKIIFENLSLNDKHILTRNSEHIFLNGQRTVKLAKEESVLHLLKEEELIRPATLGFQKVIRSEGDDSIYESVERKMAFFFDPYDKIDLKKFSNLKAIREADIGIIAKLYLTSIYAKTAFAQIKEQFINIFPFVNNIKIAHIEEETEIPDLQIKENGVDEWIIESSISSGMYKALLHLSEIHLSPEGSIILIDEFENSLGVNCIHEIISAIQNTQERQLQFIITSHHPYIINRVPYKNWKLLTRQGGRVVARDVDEYTDMSRSRQESFTQLTQLEEFATGISY